MMLRDQARQRNSSRGQRPYSAAPYRRPPVAAGHAGLGWLAASVAIIVVLSVADLVGGDKVAFSGALVLTPFLASVGARPRAVCLVGAAALAAAIVLAFFDGFLPSNGLARVSADSCQHRRRRRGSGAPAAPRAPPSPSGGRC